PLASAPSTSRNVSIPARRPWSMTTSEPMSCSAITLTASRTAPSGATVKSVLPLIRRISVTSMAAPSFAYPNEERLPLSAAAVQIVGQPQRHARPQVHDDHAQDHDEHVGHHPREDLVERHVRRRHALQV